MKAKEEKNKVTLIVILDLLCCVLVCVHHVRICNVVFSKLREFERNRAWLVKVG